MRCERDSEAGFTLIELLVSVTLLALLSVLLFGGLRVGIRSGDAVTARIGDAQQIASVSDFMSNALAAMQPLGGACHRTAIHLHRRPFIAYRTLRRVAR